MTAPVATGPRFRRLANEAVLHTIKAHGFPGSVVDLPEGDEIEVACPPKIPVKGARFFLRVESMPSTQGRAPGTPRVAVPTKLLLAWRIVPEPVAVLGLDPRTGTGRLGEVHPFLAWLDSTNRGWSRSTSVMFPLPHPLDGRTIPRLARMAADSHVLFRRLVAHMKTGAPEPAPKDLRAAASRISEVDFDATIACLDLLREAGLLEEARDRGLRATEACTSSFARAAVQHKVNARGHADPVTAEEAGRAAVARVLLSRLPEVAESTARRCAVLLARFLPVDDTDSILALADDPNAVAKALEEE